MPKTSVPVLLIAFNRPDTLGRVLGALRDAQVSRLFVACDAPRLNKPQDKDKVSAVRRMVEAIDWPCDVKTRYQSENQGCSVGPYMAMDWFFGHVEEGVVLEDDCLPHADFFPYCEQLLNRYRDDPRIMTISGDRTPLSSDTDFHGFSYGFSRFSLTWGWASWSRAWKTFDLALTSWPLVKKAGWLKGLYRDEDVYNGLYDAFEGVYTGRHHTVWDYQWTYNCLFHSGLSIIPSKNLISNIGFGADSTHTGDPTAPRASRPTEPILPLDHPELVHPWNDLDERILHEGIGVAKRPWWRKAFKRVFRRKTARVQYFNLA